MILGKTLKYLSFALIALITVNNIAIHTQGALVEPRTILTTSPYDLLIANDLRTLSALKQANNNVYQFASSLYEVDKNIKVLDLKQEYIKIKRNYIYNKDINSHLIECVITLIQASIIIESCNYNEKIYTKLKEITQPLNNQKNNPLFAAPEKEKLSINLISSIYENLLTFQFYENYLKLYLGVDGIATPEKNLETGLNLLNLSIYIENLNQLIEKDVNIDQNNLTKSKIFQYNFLNYTCETKVANKLLSLKNELRSKAPLNSPPINVETSCEDTI
jgi:hypothetical protein